MANDLVVQLGAKLDQFQSDMNQAGDIADAAVSRVERSFANLNPTLGGFASLGTSVTAAVGAVAGLVAGLASVNSELAQVAQAAKYLSTTTDEVQKLKFAASTQGIGGSDAIANLESVGKLLNDALVNENSLTKLLDKNSIQYKDQTGHLISINQLLARGADLVKGAGTEADKTTIAQMLGLTRQWVPLLEQGASGFDAIAESARDVGAVIDSDTIARAEEFDKKWRDTSTSFSTYMRSAMVDLLPLFDDIIEKADELIKSLPKRSDIKAASNESFKQFNDATGTPDSLTLTVDADNLHRALHEWQNSSIFSTSTWSEFGAALSDSIKIRTPEQAAAEIPGFAASQVKEPTYPTAAQMDAAFDKANPPNPGTSKNPLPGLSASDYSDASTKIPGKAKDTANAYDRATESITKHTARLEADAETAGKGEAAQAELRAEYQLTAAAQQAGIPITDKVRNQIQDLAQDAGLAAEELAKAKVASDIQFGSKSAFLTPQDLAIAQQLRKIYGDDVPAAMQSSEAAALRFNATIKQLGDLGQQINSAFLVDFTQQIRNGASAMDALKSAGLNALGKISDKLAQMAADQLWASAFGGSGGGGLLGLLGFPTGAVNANGSIAGAVGPTSVGGAPLVGAFASGTDSAPGGLSLIGENGPELLNIPRGSQVIPNDVLRNGGGGGGTTVHAGSTVVIQGDASEKTVALIQAALAQHDAALPGKVVSVVKRAQQTRNL